MTRQTAAQIRLLPRSIFTMISAPNGHGRFLLGFWQRMNAPAARDGPDDLSRERSAQECLVRVRTGDEAAFEQLFRGHAAALCAFAFSYVRSRETAEEIVQDLFCWIWEQRFTVEMPHGVRAWLFSAVRNRSLNAVRNSRVEFSIHERLSRDARGRPATAALPDAELSGRELAAAIGRVVAAMPARCREVFTLVREQHFSHAETSRVLGISPKTVEIHMTRALAILRAELGAWMVP
ncbi:MAG: RNA polymerase sigma-70 factor [Gemmatimonadales bacterium]